MGDEVSRRTRRAFEKAYEAVQCRLDDSIETEKEKNDFLIGVNAIVEALRTGRIECRIYRKGKFHAKAYIPLWHRPHRRRIGQSANSRACSDRVESASLYLGDSHI